MNPGLRAEEEGKLIQSVREADSVDGNSNQKERAQSQLLTILTFLIFIDILNFQNLSLQ